MEIVPMVDKAHILYEIERTAAANGGKPLGKARFREESGIRETDWLGRYWARWSDALQEAGLEANAFKGEAISEGELFDKLVGLARRLGHVPTQPEMRLERRQGRTFPDESTYQRRLGDKAARVGWLRKLCAEKGDYEDVVLMCDEYLAARPSKERAHPAGVTEAPSGFVYLLKVGRHYKIGKTNSVGRRERELAIQLPQRAQLIHQIATDDPSGIERYWHERFNDRRANGEWFELQPADVAAFKRRKFM